MELTQRDYVLKKTKNYLKKGTLFIFCNGINKNAKEWLVTEQALRKLPVKSYKIFNKATLETVQNSIYFNTINTIACVGFFITLAKGTKEPVKQHLLNDLEVLLFTVLSIKLNNTLFSKTQLQNLSTFNYQENYILFLQFRTIELKLM